MVVVGRSVETVYISGIGSVDRRAAGLVIPNGSLKQRLVWASKHEGEITDGTKSNLGISTTQPADDTIKKKYDSTFTNLNISVLKQKVELAANGIGFASDEERWLLATFIDK